MLKKAKTRKLFYAWALLLVFITANVCKMADLHLNELNHHHDKEQTTAKHTIKSVCSICEFTWHKADVARTIVYVPIINVEPIIHYITPEQTVYLTIYSINAHSPPSVA
ncbi:hypothetical protein [Prevotella ihumii]|uniref:hypothetical protein n=1 Tax=Prevotella ihumii TaxID=1917878 RepID=UPI000A04FD5D|nr:hypothetical protein [Prevotella ihumii]